MRALKTVVWAAIGAALFSIGARAADWEQSRDWYVETKRAAKYARIAITNSGDLARIDAEEAVAKRQFARSFQLPLDDHGKSSCSHAAKAVVDFIGAAKSGNMEGGPASYERQMARWDALSEECLKSIQRAGNTEETARR